MSVNYVDLDSNGTYEYASSSDCDALDKSFSIFDAFVEELCEYHKMALINKMFSECVDFVNFSFRRYFCSEWKEAELGAVRK